MKTIAFIHPDLGIGGAERLVLDVASALKKLNYKIIFLTNHFDKKHCFEDLKTDDYPIEVYGNWLPRHIFGKFQALCAYIRMIYLTLIYILFYKSNQVNLYFVDLIPISIPILKLFGQKVIYYCHHPDLLASPAGGNLKKIYRKPLDFMEMKSTAQADVILVNSEYTATVFKRTFPEIIKPIQVLYPTVSSSYLEIIEKLNPTPIWDLIPEVPENPNSVVFLSINRFHPAKKLDLAIHAMEKLKLIASPIDWKRIYFVMAGGFDVKSPINSEYYSKLVELVKLVELQDKIIFLKSPSDHFKAQLLYNCDCLVYTPVNEHFGIVPLEAMTVCKPVIACNSGGPRETIQNGKNGFLCEAEPESLADCMLKMLNKNEAKDMGIQGKKILNEKFSYEIFSKCLKKVFESNV